MREKGAGLDLKFYPDLQYIHVELNPGMLCLKPYKIKGFEHDDCDAFIRKFLQWANLIVQNMASSSASVSVSRSPLGKRLNSQTKFLLMKLWDFFEQEAKKSKVSVNVKKRILKASGIKCLQCSWDNLSYHRQVSDLSTVNVTISTAVATWRSNQSKSGEKHSSKNGQIRNVGCFCN